MQLDPQNRTPKSAWGGLFPVEPPVQLMLQEPPPQATLASTQEFGPEQLSVQAPAPHVTLSPWQEYSPLQSIVHGPDEQSTSPLHDSGAEQSS